jgi:regulator of protease activity HflC (stomatin/prohibitin superfamily)
VDALVGILVAIALLAIFVVVARSVVAVTTVHDYERGLRYARGRFRGLVPAGTHVGVRGLTEVRVLDARPMFLLVEGQEVMTSEGVPVRVSIAARYVLADPVAAVTADADFRRATYLLLQLALRDALVTMTLDDALQGRRELGPAIRDRCASDLATLGVELLAVVVRDLMVPGELKRAFAGVLAARKDGEAALERTRTETAVLRSLANAGRLVEEHPGLLQLRALQQVGGSTGNTLVVGMPDGSRAPASLKAARNSEGAGTPSPEATGPAAPRSRASATRRAAGPARRSDGADGA